MTELLVPLLSILGSGVAVVGTWLSAKLGRKAASDARQATDLAAVILRASEAATSPDPDRAQRGVSTLVALLESKRVTDDQRSQIASALREVLRAATEELEELPGTGDQVEAEVDAFDNVRFVTTWHRSRRQPEAFAGEAVPLDTELLEGREQTDG